jgi:poly(beta-D-mannuronate) lyase
LILIITVLSALITPLSIASAAIFQCAESATVEKEISNLKPGDTLQLAAGIWESVQIEISVSGSEENPITIEAIEPGKTIFTGHSALKITGSYVTVKGLVFRDNSVIDAREMIVIGNEQKEAQPSVGCRITQCAFIRCNPTDPDTLYHWLVLRGLRITVDHCRFEGMNHRGVLLQVRMDHEFAEHHIYANYFVDRKNGTQANGYETIQVGQSWDSMKIGHCLIENNLFENCDGEAEIISNKTCENRYLNNTFLTSSGCLTLRHGNGCLVEKNTFIGHYKSGTGGIRVIGENHTIRKNFFGQLDGYTGGIVVVYSGIPDSKINGYFTAKNILIEDNLWFDNAGNSIYLNGGLGSRNRTLMPENIRIRNNTFMERAIHGNVLISGTLTDQIHFENNKAFNGEIGIAPASGFEWDYALNQVPEYGLAPQNTLLNNVATPLNARDVGPIWWTE